MPLRPSESSSAAIMISSTKWCRLLFEFHDHEYELDRTEPVVLGL